MIDARTYPDFRLIFALGHFTRVPIASQTSQIPIRTGPDEGDLTWKESSFNVRPRRPRLAVPVAFVGDAGNMSRGEFYLAFVRQHRLGIIFGETTGGVNGEITGVPLDGGVLVNFTGMRVENNDGTPFHRIGVVPDFPVPRTIAGIAAGRDEALDAAISWAKSQVGVESSR